MNSTWASVPRLKRTDGKIEILAWASALTLGKFREALLDLFRLEDDSFGPPHRQPRGDVRLDRLVDADVLAGLLRQEPAVLEHLVEELRRGQRGPEVLGHLRDRRLEDLLPPL